MRVFQKDKIPFPEGYENLSISTDKPLVLEIGAGVGWHALTWSQSHPDFTYIAVEHSRARFEGLKGRWERHGRPAHLMPIHADAESFVTHCLPDASLDQVFILYPNPYPKESQANKRWHRMPFMSELLRKLKLKGEIEFATNEEFYAVEFRSEMQSVWGLKELSYSEIQKSKPECAAFEPRTHFEKKYWLRGQTLYLFRLEKTQDLPIK